MDGNTLLDFAEDDALTGFRLRRLELYNWGTFHNRIWILPLDGRNGLLTGDIGSGKSTVVDAMNTLLVPPGRVAFNKAAGADRRERDLRSYVLGYHRSERATESSSARPVPLRDRRSYSVILAVFYNAGFSQTVTLAQVFRQKENQGQPNRFYIVSGDELSIRDTFMEFGSNINELRRRIRALPNTEAVFDSFSQYSAAFRRRFGLKSEQALLLFHQMVSMKSVGNLTEFVREHMLEPFDVKPRIDALLHHYDDLSRAHEAVLRAKDQVARLTDIASGLAEHDRVVERESHLRLCRDGLRTYCAGERAHLLENRIERLTRDYDKAVHRRSGLETRSGEEHRERDRIKQAIAENGGDRLEALRRERQAKEEEKRRRLRRYEAYRDLARVIGLPDVTDSDGFVENRGRIEVRLAEVQRSSDEARNAETEHGVALQTLKREYDELAGEIASLERRRSNIDSVQIAMRDRICRALDIPEATLPFAGELLQVKEDERKWEGAAERVLRSFGLSLLVPSEWYPAVSDWVNRTDLKGRLIYYRVRTDEDPRYEVAPEDEALSTKLAIKPDTPLRDWLQRQLDRRFDYRCCRTMDDFRHAKRALTETGQIKGSTSRHEKDDRYAINDRRRFVLGWTNTDKIRTLRDRAATIERAMAEEAAAIRALQERRETAQRVRDTLVQLETTREFSDIDWRPIAARIEALVREIEQLEATSDLLRTLGDQLRALDERIAKTRAAVEKNGDEITRLDERRRIDTARLDEDRAVIDASPHPLETIRSVIDPYRREALGATPFTIENADARQQELREWLQARIDGEVKRERRLAETIVSGMRDFQRDYPSETQEFDASVEAAHEYLRMLEQLKRDDLPRFEAKFKQLLNENTIREIANFEAQLVTESETIRDRVRAINRSLAEIEYESGRYIRLEALATPERDIKSFQTELRNCIAGTIGGVEDNRYTEAKFEEVKAIIDRFRGREGTAEIDLRWTQRVTDVRSWFVFAASVRWSEDDAEYEHYTDSSGKSGGQKEKLAYTILAASVAYQFGLEWGETKSRSFRCVVIDEAFGRGSDESTRFALELFKKLNLQLVIVTPLQKIHIIEPYVSTVGFVHNRDGRNSMLHCLTVEEYRAKRIEERDETPRERTDPVHSPEDGDR